MKRLMIVLTALMALMLGFSSHAMAEDKKSGNVQFQKAKNGLLLSAGLINLIEKEGEISMEDERITCQRIRKTGSNLKETFCLTVQEAQVARERSQTTMWRYMQGVTR